MSVSAIVLAAGASRRMGAPKALLRLGGRTFAARVVDTLRAAGLEDIVVVTREELAAGVRAAVACEVVVNPEPERGMLSSLQAGLRIAPEGAVLLALVDQPTLSLSAVRTVLQAYAGNPDRIVLPVRDGRRGHPVVFPPACRAELLSTPDEGGARAVVRRDPARVLEVPVEDDSPILDLDSPADLDRLRGA